MGLGGRGSGAIGDGSLVVFCFTWRFVGSLLVR